MIYICKYGNYNPDQPRIGKLANSLSKKFKVVWIVPSSDIKNDDVIVVGGKNKFTYFLNATKYIRKVIKKEDIVFGYMHIGAVIGYASTINKNAKFVYDYADPWKGWYFFKTKEDNLKWKLSRRIFYFLEKVLYKKAYYAIASSYSQLEFLIKQHGKKKNSTIIFNCPSIKDFNTENKDPKLAKKLKLDEKEVLMFLGAIVSEYGCDYVIEALAKIKKTFPNIALIFLGRASPEYQEHLNILISKYNLKENVIFTRVPMKIVPHYLNMAKIGFIPFKNIFYNSCGAPNKLFEYMSCGIVPVCSNLKELSNHIKNWENGLLVKPESSDAIGEATIALLKNKKVMDKIRKNNIEKIRSEFNWEKQEKKLLDIFEDIK